MIGRMHRYPDLLPDYLIPSILVVRQYSTCATNTGNTHLINRNHNLLHQPPQICTRIPRHILLPLINRHARHPRLMTRIFQSRQLRFEHLRAHEVTFSSCYAGGEDGGGAVAVKEEGEEVGGGGSMDRLGGAGVGVGGGLRERSEGGRVGGGKRAWGRVGGRERREVGEGEREMREEEKGAGGRRESPREVEQREQAQIEYVMYVQESMQRNTYQLAP